MSTKTSPYTEFKNWLLNSYPNAKLSEEVIKAINPKTVLHMFGNLGGITIFLDEYFNNFDLMNCNPLEFYNFLREVVQKHKIRKYDFSFFYNLKKDALVTKLQKKLPHLKKYEIYSLLEYCKEDDENDSFLENLELNKSKIKKMKKSKSTKKTKEEVPSEAKTFEHLNIQNIKTWEDWKKCFNMS